MIGDLAVVAVVAAAENGGVDGDHDRRVLGRAVLRLAGGGPARGHAVPRLAAEGQDAGVVAGTGAVPCFAADSRDVAADAGLGVVGRRLLVRAKALVNAGAPAPGAVLGISRSLSAICG